MMNGVSRDLFCECLSVIVLLTLKFVLRFESWRRKIRGGGGSRTQSTSSGARCWVMG